MFCNNLNKEDDSFDQIKYSLPTRMGNWVNELAIEEANMAVIAYKKAHGLLLSSRTREMLKNLLEPVNLESTSLEGIECGMLYQICSPYLPFAASRKGLYLSGMLSEHDIERGVNLMHGCLLTASQSSVPCRRNTFAFVSNAISGDLVSFGDDVFIQINSDTDKKLYVQAEGCTIDNFGDSLNVRLSEQPDVYCHFKLLHPHPALRQDTLGMTILPDSNVIIQHLASGRNLAAESNRWMTTFFGSECMATCHTYKNSNRIESAENIWQIQGSKGRYSSMMAFNKSRLENSDNPPC